MAKKKGSSISMDFKGVPLKKLLSIDMNTINRMDRSTLEDITKRLVATANRRITQLEKKKLQHISSAYIQRKEGAKAEMRELRLKRKKARSSEGKLKIPKGRRGRPKLKVHFTIEDNTRNKLMETYAKAKKFLASPTSTAQGVEKVQNDIESAVGRPLTKSEWSRLWKLYNKLDQNAISAFGFDSKQIRNDIARRVARRKYKDIGTYERNEDILAYWERQFERKNEEMNKPYDFNDNTFQTTNLLNPNSPYGYQIKENDDALEQGDSILDWLSK